MGIGEGKGAGPGIFITFEGGDGAGKTTHLNFLAKALRATGCDVICLREPGGTPIGEDLRAVVLDENNSNMSDETELLIYEAARAQLVREVICSRTRWSCATASTIQPSRTSRMGAGFPWMP